MFALQNLNILLSNITQMPTLAKYGIFQSSSFTKIKKFPEVDVVCSELSQNVQLIKDLKCERFLDFLASSKFDLTLRAAEWSSFEDAVYKLTKGKRREFTSLNTKCKEAPTSAMSLNDTNEVNETISEKKGDNPNETLSQCSKTESCHQQPSDNPPSSNEENKKSASFISHFSSFKIISNQSIFMNGSMYVNPGGGMHLNAKVNGLFQDQRRGFKTERQLKLEVDRTVFNKMANLLLDKLHENKESEQKTVKEGEGKSKFLKAFRQFSEVLRVMVYGLVIYFLYETYRWTRFQTFTTNTTVENGTVKFSDVKGMEEAKEELKCVVDYLRNPSKFLYLGGKLPTGIILHGPPGNGKTLLARAVAGEAGVTFLHMSGSEFDEILVGEGARRVRNLFRAARLKSPAVIFIDEIDAIGGKRVSDGFHPYANQTIVQLLSELDGFTKNDRIIVIGATNRMSDMDEALLRPGRFDLKILVNLPDIGGRREILKLYLKKIVSKDVDVEYIAKNTVGFSGADLATVVNQAALLAARHGCEYVTTEHLDKAVEKVMFGPALKSRTQTEQMKRLVAYHESGHVLVGYFTPNASPPTKATIIPHGHSLGLTRSLPDEKSLPSKSVLLAKIDAALGGRAAEELIFGPDKVTAGSEADLKSATDIARKMVCMLGMSDKVGLRTYNNKIHPKFGGDQEIGPTAEDEIDEEIKKILQESYERAKKILKKHAKEHKLLAEKLLEKETLNSDEIKEILGKCKDDDLIKE